MPLNYYGNRAGDMEAASSIGANVASIAFAHPLMQQQQQRYQEQLALMKAQEILRNAQVQEAQSRAKYYDKQSEHSAAQTQYEGARTKDVMAKTQRENSVGGASNEVGILEGLRGMLQNAPVGQQNPMLGQQMDLARQRGLLPNEGFAMERGSLVNQLAAMIQARAMQNAVSTAGGAATMMTPRNIPEGGTGVNAFGPTGVMGQPKPIMMNPNQSAVIPGQGVINPNVFIANRGQTIFGDDGSVKLQGQQFPDPADRPQNIGGLAGTIHRELAAMGVTDPQYDDLKKLGDWLDMQLGYTNAPPSITTKIPSATNGPAKIGRFIVTPTP